MEQPTHKERMKHLKENDPITYSELHSNPTGVDSDDDLGAIIFSIIFIGSIIFAGFYFFSGK